MIISESIRTWVRDHTLQETLLTMGAGVEIRFAEEGISTKDSMVITAITAAYTFFEIQRELRSEIGRAVYLRKAAAEEYVPRLYLGYKPGTFQPSDERKYIIEMFTEAAEGVEADEIAEWLNDCGLRTVKGNEITPRAVKAMLANPVYCGDVVFHKAGKWVQDHHEGLVSREIWERAQKDALQEITRQPNKKAA